MLFKRSTAFQVVSFEAPSSQGLHDTTGFVLTSLATPAMSSWLTFPLFRPLKVGVTQAIFSTCYSYFLSLKLSSCLIIKGTLDRTHGPDVIISEKQVKISNFFIQTNSFILNLSSEPHSKVSI